MMPSTPYTYTSPDDPAREDEGLFGPGSMTWRVMSNRIMWVAVVRALYLQALHPRVIRGTLQNAATITEPADAWARLRRTRKFIETRTFGTTAEADRAGRRVRRIHDSLTGTDLDGTRYRVDEPELLLWVHCGEVASCADIAQRSRLPFSAADLDAFVDEQGASADLIGLDRAAAPASMADLGAYYEEIRPRLYACDEARQALRMTLHPPVPDGNRVLKLGLPPVAALAFGTLPGWARRMYGRPGGPISDMAATAGLRATRLALSQERLFLGAMQAIHRAESATETGRPEHGQQALREAHLDVEAASGAGVRGEGGALCTGDGAVHFRRRDRPAGAADRCGSGCGVDGGQVVVGVPGGGPPPPGQQRAGEGELGAAGLCGLRRELGVFERVLERECGGEVLSIPLVRGRWKPFDARRDEQEHEAMVAAELAKLALSRSEVPEATVSSGNGLYDRTDSGHSSQ